MDGVSFRYNIGTDAKQIMSVRFVLLTSRQTNHRVLNIRRQRGRFDSLFGIGSQIFESFCKADHKLKGCCGAFLLSAENGLFKLWIVFGVLLLTE